MCLLLSDYLVQYLIKCLFTEYLDFYLLSISPSSFSLFHFWLFSALEPIFRILFLTGFDQEEVKAHL